MTAPLAVALTDTLAAARMFESTSGERLEGVALRAHADRVAAALAAHGVAPHEPVHVRVGNRPADLAALLGIWLAGAVAVPIQAAAVPATVARLQQRTKARFGVDGERIDMLAASAPPARPLLEGAALVIFTSGSTGEPKGVVIGHERFAGKLAVLDRLLGVRPDDVVLMPLQMAFIFGLWVALMRGARLVVVPKFSRDAIAHGLRDATVLAGVPSMFRTLLADGAPPAPHLRAIFTGGEILSPKLAAAMGSFANAAIYDLYGLTETGSCDFCVPPALQPAALGTIGKPTEGVAFRIVQDGAAVAPGETGELQIRTPFGMLGYFDDPTLTQSSFADGYFKTGDLARITPDGFVQLVGRAKDMVSRGGIKIAPLEIDHLLAAHPGIAAALCAGVPDDRLGEVIHAVVVPRAGAQLDQAALRDWMLARTEPHKVPEVFHIRDSLPVGGTGKADRRAVAALARAIAVI
ncbi:MAG TPA: fatty acid--CoA ligase family protein [Xanthobacteraceae bacterium]|nr:fatty acid--CoA ligase family protein [Xanthobacteraceae bacterium]